LLIWRWVWYSQAKAWEVSLNGEVLGIVAQVDDLMEAVEIRTSEVREERELEDVGVASQIDFRFVLSTKKDDVEHVKQELLEGLEFGLKAAVLVVDGQEIASLSSREEAEGILEELKVKFLRPNSIEVETLRFREPVEIIEKYRAVDDIIDRDTALNILLYGSETILQHTVARGETFWGIANLYKLGVSVLQAANPSVKPERLQIGTKLSLKIDEPYLRVEATEKVKYTQAIPFSTTYVNDNSLWNWENKVKTAGRTGTQEVVARVISVNGKEEKREILSTTVISEPTTRVISRGTKNAPSHSTGSFLWPTTGTITSPFGPRWGGYHSGVDIGASNGTPIKAADSGIVSFAGYNGGYGYMVKIEHGDGFSTLYAHASRLLVSQNDYVEKGHAIALVGNTGKSYGSHLHFEIHVSGRPVNPLNYFR
jgi:murein DD-endopeptidase MepM/ murein hydrolase activator NlpD